MDMEELGVMVASGFVVSVKRVARKAGEIGCSISKCIL